MTAGSPFAKLVAAAFVVAAGFFLSACMDSDVPKHLRAVPRELQARMEQLGMTETSPIYVRVFKEESQLEIWKQTRGGRYALLKTYEICKWSGTLGPKIKEGDRQAPEGFYTVTPAQMNPNSSYYLSFNIGYPNAYDRSLGRTGSNVMVHGACSSAGCYSMNDEPAGEIFALARDALRGGQRAFQVHAFPFRMTAENMARHRSDPNMDFWRMLKDGYDHFEVTHQVPKVDVCNRQYIFDADAGTARFNPEGACPAYTVPAEIQMAVAAKQAADAERFQLALAAEELEKQQASAAAFAAAEAERNAALAAAQQPAVAPGQTPGGALISRILGNAPAPPPGAPADPAPADAAAAAAMIADGMPVPRPNPLGRTPAGPAAADTPAAPAPAPQASSGGGFLDRFAFWKS